VISRSFTLSPKKIRSEKRPPQKAAATTAKAKNKERQDPHP
jgi:hypothetical protein